MGFATLRRQRIHFLLEIIRVLQKEDGRADLRKVIASAAYNWGLTERKIREYLRILEDFGAIEIKDEFVYLKRYEKDVKSGGCLR